MPRAIRLARYTILPLPNTYLVLTGRQRRLEPNDADADGGGGERGPAGDQPAARHVARRRASVDAKGQDCWCGSGKTL